MLSCLREASRRGSSLSRARTAGVRDVFDVASTVVSSSYDTDGQPRRAIDRLCDRSARTPKHLGRDRAGFPASQRGALSGRRRSSYFVGSSFARWRIRRLRPREPRRSDGQRGPAASRDLVDRPRYGSAVFAWRRHVSGDLSVRDTRRFRARRRGLERSDQRKHARSSSLLRRGRGLRSTMVSGRTRASVCFVTRGSLVHWDLSRWTEAPHLRRAIGIQRRRAAMVTGRHALGLHSYAGKRR